MLVREMLYRCEDDTKSLIKSSALTRGVFLHHFHQSMFSADYSQRHIARCVRARSRRAPTARPLRRATSAAALLPWRLRAALSHARPPFPSVARSSFAMNRTMYINILYSFVFHIYSFIYSQCNRYMCGLWLSHNRPALALLRRMLPPGIMHYLSAPAYSASERRALERKEETRGQVRLFCTVTFRANPSHNLTRSP